MGSKAIIFDCFGVFYVDPVLAYVDDPRSPKDTVNVMRELDEQADRGRLSKSAFIDKASELLGLSPLEVDERFFRGHVRNDELLGFVRELRVHYKVALLSNIGADMMDGFFTPQERTELFDAVVLSGGTGYAKPDPEIFWLTCKRLNVEPQEAVMIDDRLDNCAGARAAGLRAVQYESFAQMKRQIEELLTQ